MSDLLFGTITQKGWPWKRPKAGNSTITDTYNGHWIHISTQWDWWTFRWVLTFRREVPK